MYLSFAQGSGIIIITARGQLHAAHHQKLQRIVQHCRIGAIFIDNGNDFAHFILQHIVYHILFTGVHPVHIAADRIDFSVVNDKAIRMRSLPAGKGIGTEPGVDHGDGRLCNPYPANPGRSGAAPLP